MENASRIWQQAERAALCLAVGGPKLGGAVLHVRHGPVREAWCKGLREAVSPLRPWRKIPSHCGIDQLQGGIDLSATLEKGEPVHTTGLLQATQGGIAELVMAERAEPHLAAAMTQSLDQASVTLLAMAENQADEPGVPASLSNRLAFYLDLDALPHQAIEAFAFDAETLDGVAEEALAITISDLTIEAIAATTMAFGIASMRPAMWALEVARILAAYDGLDEPDQAIIAEACGLVLSHRATQMPSPPDDDEEDDQPPEPPPPENQDEQNKPDNQDDEKNELEDKLIESVRAEIPADLLADLLGGDKPRAAAITGAAGQWQKPAKRGRAIGLRRGDLRRESRIDLVASLTAAAPWQPWRRKFATKSAKTMPIILNQDDLRFKKFKERRGTLMIFAVDASGSAAINRLGEAKGAVELILAQCYVRRDEAALIAFRQNSAQILLPPTRSLTRAKKLLAALPGGGGTPIASALKAGALLAEQTIRKGMTPYFVLLSDGRGNIDLDGLPDREKARADMHIWAENLARLGIKSIMIDTSSRRQQAKLTPGPELAKTMNAKYLVLPMANAERLANVIQSEVDHA